MSESGPLASGSNAFPTHVFDLLGEGLNVLEKRIGGSVMMAAGQIGDGPHTVITAGASRLLVAGPPVELAVEVLPEQEGAAVIALQIVCNDMYQNQRTPPLEAPWVNPEPFLAGTQITSILATGSRWGAEFDEVRESDGQLAGWVRTIRLLTTAEAEFVQQNGWAALVDHVGSVDALLDVERDSAARANS